MIQQYIFHKGHTPDEVIQAKLLRSSYFREHQLGVEYHEGQVTLSGTVSSYYQKQVAQESVRGMTGVDQIENNIVVSR